MTLKFFKRIALEESFEIVCFNDPIEPDRLMTVQIGTLNFAIRTDSEIGSAQLALLTKRENIFLQKRGEKDDKLRYYVIHNSRLTIGLSGG